MTTALIGNISRYSLADGPGIRTTIFFKGCPLGCIWCHNPELQGNAPELSFDEKLCIGCGECVTACTSEAIVIEETCRIDSALCTLCMDCVEACPAQALRTVGTEYSIEELLEIIERDSHFYSVSGGGITFSGGEPTAQLDFLLEFTQVLQNKNIHCAIETCGLFVWNATTEELFQELDLIYFDMKVANGPEHKKLTGCSNEGIIENLRRLALSNREKVIVSVPLIPHYTASSENLQALAELLKRIGILKIRLLPYHPFKQPYTLPATRKSQQRPLPEKSMKMQELLRWKDFFENLHFTVRD